MSVDSLCESLDLSKDGIAVVLNEADCESIKYLLSLKIPFVALPENRGVLAIDYLLPFVENSEYFVDTNDDMIFHKGFAEDLISIIEKNYPCSASCTMVENFFSNNPCVCDDDSLGDFYDEDSQRRFQENIKAGKYIRDKKIVSFTHPICVKSSDYLRVGGYSGGWDMDFFSGYGRDDMFPYMLSSLHKGNFKFIQSNRSFVFHASSATMGRMSEELKNQDGWGKFEEKTGVTVPEFRQSINLFSAIN